MTASQSTSIQQLRQSQNTDLAVVNMFSAQGFELAQRIARAYQTANAVPAAFRAFITKREKRGNDYFDVEVENPSAMGNCIVAIETAQAVGMSITAVMQNANVIEGRLSWSGKFVIAAINASRRFSPLRFRTVNKGVIKAAYKEKGSWNRDERRYNVVEKTVEIENIECVAWAYVMEGGRRTDEIIEGVPVSIKMAVEEGWYSKPGSKWQTELKHLMLQYRAGSFFGNIHAPDIVMGMGRTSEELEDMRNVIEATTAADGSIQVDFDQLRQREPVTEQAAQKTKPEAEDVEVRNETRDATDQSSEAPEAQRVAPSSGRAHEDTDADGLTFDQVAQRLREAPNQDVLELAAGFIGEFESADTREELNVIYVKRAKELKAAASEQQPEQQRRARRATAPE